MSYEIGQDGETFEPQDARLEAEELAKQLGPMIRLARSLVESEHAAEDIVQDLFVNVLRRPPRIQTNLGGWVRTVLTRKAKRHSWNERSRKARQETVAKSAHAAHTDDVHSAQGDAQILAAAVARLAEPYRSVIHERFYSEASIKEIAARLNRPAATVKSQIARGLEKLRLDLDGHYGSRDERLAGLAVLISLRDPSSGHAHRTTPVAGTVGLPLLVIALASLAGLWLPTLAKPAVDRTAPPQSATDGSTMAQRAPALLSNREPIGEPSLGTSKAQPVRTSGLRVADESGQPVAGALVWGILNRGRRELGYTDADGWLAQDLVDAGPRPEWIKVEAAGFASSSIRAPESQESPLRFVLSRDSIDLSLTVVTSDRQPVAGAIVRISAGSASTDIRNTLVERADSDHQGRATFKGLPAGYFALTVESDGFTTYTASGTLGEMNQEQVIVLDPGTQLIGQVLLDDGSPAADASIRLDALNARTKVRARCDPAGTFHLSTVPTGTHRFWATSADGLRMATAILEMRPQEPTEWNPVLRRTTGLKLDLVDGHGAPIKRRLVTLRQSNPTPWRRVVRSDGQGQIDAAVVPGVETEVLIRNVGRSRLDVYHTVLGADEVAKTIVVPDPGNLYEITGSVSGHPLDELHRSGLVLIVDETTQRYVTAPVDETGHFTARLVPDGTYRLFWSTIRLGSTPLARVQVSGADASTGELEIPGLGALELLVDSSEADPWTFEVVFTGPRWSETPRSRQIEALQRVQLYPGQHRLRILDGSRLIDEIEIPISSGELLTRRIATRD